MVKRISCGIAVLSLLAAAAWTQDIKLPVFFLRYEGGTEVEDLDEEEEEDGSIFDSQRHKLTLRIKEQWSDAFTTNLYTAAYFKLYDDPSDNYRYFYLNPNYIWDIGDRIRWSSEFRCKWTMYEELDSFGKSKDVTSLRAKTELPVKLLDQLKVIPSFQGVFDLYENPEKRQQIYTAGIRLESRINPQLRLNSRYRAILRAPLGPESTVSGEDKHEFGVNLSWDPNK
jgi:hypothetical protein